MGAWQDFLRFLSADQFCSADVKARPRSVFPDFRPFLWCLVAIGGTLAGAPEAAEARIETLRWTHPNPAIVDGYRIFGRYEGQGYTTPWFDDVPVASGGVYEVEFDVDDDATVYFVATAYNQTQESVLSNELMRSPPFCGDGSVDPGEQCDDGNSNDGDGCDSICRIEIPPACGDGSVDPGEQCDDGNVNSGDGCDASCRVELPPICGDGSLDAGEQCDDGNANNGDGCDAACRIEILPICGDGNVDPGEQCDDGNANNGDGCDAVCRIELPPVCGDGSVDPGEQCDDGNVNNGDGCDAICRIELPPACGDGSVDPGEQCDDGNTSSGDGCDSICRIELPPACGDGSVDPGEQCDDGNSNSGDGCDATCRIELPAMCGDGSLDPGEQCDDGNANNGDGCDATCRVELPAMCGDGSLDPGEQCDDGNTNGGDGCDATCRVEVPMTCGDGSVDPGEQCDDGNIDNGDGCDDSCTTEPLDPPTLLLNPDFDANIQLGGWTPLEGRIDWAALDVDGLDESGSARVSGNSNEAGGILSECVPVRGGSKYTYGGWGYRPGRQAGNLRAKVLWFRDATCKYEIADDTVSTALVAGNWSLAEGSANAPFYATSALLELSGTGGGGRASTSATYVDAVSLVPEPGPAEAALTSLLALALIGRARRARTVER